MLGSSDRVSENFVSLVDQFHRGCGGFDSMRIAVWVVLLAETQPSALYDFLRGFPRYLQIVVMGSNHKGLKDQ